MPEEQPHGIDCTLYPEITRHWLASKDNVNI